MGRHVAQDIRNFHFHKKTWKDNAMNERQKNGNPGANISVRMTRKISNNRGFKYRFFWTWDHSTNWDLNETGLQESGCHNPYLKRPQAFLNDYKRVIDYMSAHGLNGLIIWGFLRSGHGGIKSAQALCDYADKKGVKILPGMGVLSYGGVWYEGEHRFNLDTHLKKHPDLAAVDQEGNQLLGHAVACPSRRENLEWMEQGVAWLADTFNIGGVNLETGDYGICYCPQCRAAADRSSNGTRVSFADMARIYPVLAKILRNKIPDAWISYATYTDFQGTDLFNSRHMPGSESSLLSRIPEYAIAQWTLTSMLEQGENAAGKNTLPTRHNIGFFHQGSQWSGGRYEPVAGIIKKACDIAQTNKLEGLVTHGEVSPASVPNELNYLAFEYFTKHSDGDIKDFALEFSGQYGGSELSMLFMNLVEKTPNQGDVARAKKICDLLSKGMKDQEQWRIYRRWQWLADYLSQKWVKVSTRSGRKA